MRNHHHSHKKRYAAVWIALLVLTAITVDAASYNFGELNILIAMFIATVKATLVCLFFMHLIDDNRVNQVVFASSFLFLAIFVALTASDALVRPVFSKVQVTVVAEPVGDAEAMKKFMEPSDEFRAQGKTVYAAQCATCHGPAGKGDGPAAAALTPKPRNFTSGEWKLGGTPAQVFNTISKGSPGTSMPPFDTLSVKDRWALVHYVRSLSPNQPEETEETLNASGLLPAEGQAKPTTPELPIDFTIERMVEGAR